MARAAARVEYSPRPHSLQGKPMTSYRKFEQRAERLAAINEAAAVLHWDLATVMPKGGAAARAEQLAALKAVAHGMLTGKETEDLIGEASEDGTLDAWQRANVRELRRQFLHASALPEDLVVASSKAQSACETVWREARPKGDFALILPHLERVLGLIREEAAAKAAALGLDPYDALLDGYEPGLRSSDFDRLFTDLEAFLKPFLRQVMERQKRRPAPLLPAGPFPVEKQRALASRLMTAFGFDFDHGRLDVSLHPFCGGTPDDVRITTRYDEGDFTQGLMGVLHETGHALYERGLPIAWRRQPVGQSLGMAIHESQSLLIEMQVCRSRAFLGFAAPLMREAFGGSGPAWDADNLFRLYTRVEPGFIRVHADEATYPLHVILRYRLEKALVQGTMCLADLPAAWNEGMTSMLGLTVASDREGCLQDLHWYDGAWGYFPTYTLGAMAAAQLFAAAVKADPAIAEGLPRGDFQPLVAWLRANIHTCGALYSGPELLKKATGQALDPEAFKSHLKSRYLA